MEESSRKCWNMLENNPEVMNKLAAALGLSDQLAFYDVWSFDDPDLLAAIPRPVFALLVIIPHTPAWEKDRKAEADAKDWYQGSGPHEPVLWFQQTIGHACGSIGMLHCAINGPAAEFILPNSTLDTIRKAAIPLKMEDRAEMLYNNMDFDKAHRACETIGDTAIANDDNLGQHFVAFVGAQGRLWELEGSTKGPADRGPIEEGEDMLSPRVLGLGFQRVINLENSAGNDLRFSCIALAARKQ